MPFFMAWIAMYCTLQSIYCDTIRYNTARGGTPERNHTTRQLHRSTRKVQGEMLSTDNLTTTIGVEITIEDHWCTLETTCETSKLDVVVCYSTAYKST